MTLSNENDEKKSLKTDCNNENFIKELESNDTFEVFLSNDFDVKEYANTIIESQLIGESLKKLADGVSLLNKEILNQVSHHHEELLLQATGIETLEGTLQSIQSRILSLVKSLERLRSQVSDPYNRIASRTKQLRRLQTTCEYLRRVIRILQLNKRLRIQLKSGAREITKAAQSINELDYVMEGVDLSGIEAIATDIEQIKQAKISVDKQAKEMLDNGLNSQNQTLIGSSLQVFYNLNSLDKQVEEVIDNYTGVLTEDVKAALNIKNVSNLESSAGQVKVIGQGGDANWGNVLWTNMENLMKTLLELCKKVFLMEKVLSRKRDPVSHVVFLETFCEDECSTVFNSFWHTLCSNLRSEVDRVTQDSSQIKQAFEGEFPKALHIFNDFWTQISSVIESSKVQVAQSFRNKEIKIGFHSADPSEPLKELKSAFSPFENAYLARSLSRLSDSINLVFPSGATSMPSKEDLSNILKTVSSELNVASVDEHLMILVTKNVHKTIKIYINKCEQMLVTTPDAGQLSGGLTNSQIRNASIVNSLYVVYNGMSEILTNLVYPPQETVNVLSDSLSALDNFMDIALSLLLSRIIDSLDNKMIKMHSENFTLSTESYHRASEMQPYSRYIKDIEEFIARIYSDYLSLYNCGDFLIKRLEFIAELLLELFIRHACLIRDLSEGGKLRIIEDMTQLELAVSVFCRKIEDLGASYKLFRSFRLLLFQPIADVPSNPSIGDTIPYSVVLHFLFSKAPKQLASPHILAGWTIPQYSKWLDDHVEESERIALISGTVEAYVKKMKQQNENAELDEVYHIMTKILNRIDRSNVK